MIGCPYRKPTQVSECKCTKAYERNIVRELGKTEAVTSGEGLVLSGRKGPAAND